MLRPRRSSMDANADCLSHIVGATQPRPGARAPARHFSPRRLRAARFSSVRRAPTPARPRTQAPARSDARASPNPSARSPRRLRVPDPQRRFARRRPRVPCRHRLTHERPRSARCLCDRHVSRPDARASPTFGADSRCWASARPCRTGPRRASSRGAALPLRRAPAPARPRPATLSRAADARASPIFRRPASTRSRLAT